MPANIATASLLQVFRHNVGKAPSEGWIAQRFRRVFKWFYSVSAFPWETDAPPGAAHRESVEGASGWPPIAGVFEVLFAKSTSMLGVWVRS